MAETPVLMVRRLESCHSSTKGEMLKLEVTTSSSRTVTVFVPYGLASGLIGGLIAASTAAHAKRLEALGSEQTLLEVEGLTSIKPTNYDTGRNTDDKTGDSSVFLRLKKGALPLINLIFDPHQAETLGKDLIFAARKGPSRPRTEH